MKSLPLENPAYRYVVHAFKEWLDSLGYAAHTIQNLPLHVQEFLHYLEKQGFSELTAVSKENIRTYYKEHLKVRANKRYGGGLSAAHLNKHLQALYKFCDYLRQSGKLIIAPLNIRWEEKNQDEPCVLTESEIKALYKACDQFLLVEQGSKMPGFYQNMALRDKAMLSVYYGCGLRSNEGLHVELSDILWDKELLFVRKGKGYKERFVPMSKQVIKHLENYVYDARPMLLKAKQSERLFINERGNAMRGQSMLIRLHILVERTENRQLKEKQPVIHSLRHSIATHLLQNGMDLEKIKDFLGHSSLESTQIYTHLVHEEV